MRQKILFILHLPKDTKIRDIRRVDDTIFVDVKEGGRKIESGISLAVAKEKYG